MDNKLKLLKSAAIYGANASGKSNLVKALGFMRWFMVNSSKETQSTDAIGVEYFRLSEENENEPSFFELVFLMNGRKYRYGFKAIPQKIVSEWLFYVPKQRETKLFEREFNNIQITKTYNAEGLQQRTRENALFLSVSAQFNVEIAEEILLWITENLNITSGLNSAQHLNYTINCIINDENKLEILQLVRDLDLGIDDIKVEQEDLTLDSISDDIPDELKALITTGQPHKKDEVGWGKVKQVGTPQ